VQRGVDSCLSFESVQGESREKEARPSRVAKRSLEKERLTVPFE